MRTNLSILCITLVTVSIFLSCQKEVSVENNNSTNGNTNSNSGAIYALVPSANNCSDAMLAGNVVANTALNSNVYITVTVDVTKIGNWTFSTSTVNGFSFAGAGHFTTTGKQAIRLNGGGTPTAEGNTNFNLNIGSSACNITVSVSAASSNNTLSGIYYKLTIDGKTYFQDVTDTNGYEAGSGSGGDDDASFNASISYGSPPAPAGATAISVEKATLHHNLNSTNNYFKAFFAPGDYPYAPAAFYMTTGEGIRLNWTDPSGEEWSTMTEKSDQTGSIFKIVSVEDYPDAIGRYYIKVKMQFTCKLYNVITGAVKQVTNGEMVGIFGKM